MRVYFMSDMMKTKCFNDMKENTNFNTGCYDIFGVQGDWKLKKLITVSSLEVAFSYIFRRNLASISPEGISLRFSNFEFLANLPNLSFYSSSNWSKFVLLTTNRYVSKFWIDWRKLYVFTLISFREIWNLLMHQLGLATILNELPF